MKASALGKITVTFQADPSGAAPGDSGRSAGFTFIYGIGTEGLTPFEALLNEREEREEVSFTLAPADAKAFFGHLAPPLDGLLNYREVQRLHVRIDRVEAPEPREVIRAMAEMVSHGHRGGCDCGCGCG